MMYRPSALIPSFLSLLSLLSLASVVLSAPPSARSFTLFPTPSHRRAASPLVESNKLRRKLTRSALLYHAVKLQSFANADPDGNRAFGGTGHRLTVDYIESIFHQMSAYYTVSRQAFTHEYAYGASSLQVEGEPYESLYFTYSPATYGPLQGQLADTFNHGCEPADYPPAVAGKIALVSRGTCEFGLKSVLAGNAGAEAILIYNNVPGAISSGTYSSPSRPQGAYVPGALITQDAGLRFKADIAAGAVDATFNVDAVLENRTTHNIIAQSIQGNPDQVVVAGGHSDSVGGGPGINDNGSGIISILEVAVQLASSNFTLTNAVRFCFFSAEEFGLVGSEYYVANLAASEQDKIALYLNFDMIASPNYVYFIYDGDGSAFNSSGPPGSAHIEHMFTDFFSREMGVRSAPTAFTGRSDYGPFLDVGIPAGGLFTGAEGLKTKEEAEIWGGKAGEPYDVNYHKAGDDLKNLSLGGWITNTKAVAHGVATYARSTDGIPKREKKNNKKNKKKRELTTKAKRRQHHSHCGQEDYLL